MSLLCNICSFYFVLKYLDIVTCSALCMWFMNANIYQYQYQYQINMQVTFGNRKIATAQSLKFWGLTIETTLTWKHHIGELSPRLNKVCYAIRSNKPFMSLDVLRSTYFSYAHSIISYGTIFWGNSSCSEDIFKIQKIIIRIIMNSSRNASCWNYLTT
jgi:hypothetical protein